MRNGGVLVTRPEGQAQALCNTLRERGFRPVPYPLIEIEALAEPDARQRRLLAALDEFHHIVFISSNAVRCGMRWIENHWPRLPDGPHWYAMGAGSAAALAAHGVPVERPRDQMNTEGLLQLPGFDELSGQSVLIVKGVGGRETLRAELETRGARVEELAAYRRRCPVRVPGELAALIQSLDCGVLLLSSGEALHNMVSLLSAEELESARELRVIVPGERVAGLAREAGFSNVGIAANATDEAMAAALNGFGSEGGG